MADNYQTAIIIPARYASTRFPGKPLAMLDGKPIIQHVWKTASAVCHEVYVATDDERIAKTVASFGGNAIMTSSDLRSGTDRIAQAYSRMTKKYDFIINIQGDEPFIHKEQISALMHCLEDNNAEIATVVKPFASDAPIESLENENSPKVVISKDMKALYFSRSVIPFVRGKIKAEWLKEHTFYKHIGIYGFRGDVLTEITKLPSGSLEKAESLEQLRWLENGYTINVVVSNYETVGIDTPHDLERAAEYIRNNRHNEI